MPVDLEKLLHDRAITPSRPLDISATRAAAVRLRRTRHSTAAALALMLVVTVWAGPLHVSRSATPLISEVPETVVPVPPAEPGGDLDEETAPDDVEAIEALADPVHRDEGSGPLVTADGDPPAGRDVPPAPEEVGAATVVAWSFDDGIDAAWTDRKDGQTDAGVRYGSEGVSTGSRDPRRSWVSYADGRAGTAAMRARRLDSAGDVNSAYMISPDFVFPRKPAEIEVSLWYRWDGQGDDQVDIVLLDGIGLEVPLTSLTRSSASAGTWTHLVLTLQPSDEDVGPNDIINVGLRTTFRAPPAGAACTSDTASTGTDCDLGFTLDDLRVSVR